MSVRDFERSAIHDLFKAMVKFYTSSLQARELNVENKSCVEKNQKLMDRILLLKGKKVRSNNEVVRLQIVERKQKEKIEEYRMDSIEKDTRIGFLGAKCQELSSSLEAAKDEAIAAFMKSNVYKKHMDEHYAAGYEDFCIDVGEVYLEMDFSSFKVPTANESSLLQMSSENVNIIDDASTEPIKDIAELTKDDPKSGDAPSVTK